MDVICSFAREGTKKARDSLFRKNNIRGNYQNNYHENIDEIASEANIQNIEATNPISLT